MFKKNVVIEQDLFTWAAPSKNPVIISYMTFLLRANGMKIGLDGDYSHVHGASLISHCFIYTSFISVQVWAFPSSLNTFSGNRSQKKQNRRSGNRSPSPVSVVHYPWNLLKRCYCLLAFTKRKSNYMTTEVSSIRINITKQSTGTGIYGQRQKKNRFFH